MVKKATFALLVLISVYILMYTVFIFVFERPILFEIAAHRGDSSAFSENTLKAFQSAFDKKADYIELDLHQTKDNVIVVIHDETVDRTTNGTGLVRDYLYEDIKALDAGDGERIPTFEEVIELAKKENGKIIAEIKSPVLYPGIEERVHNLILKASFEKEIIVASFDHSRLEQFHEIYPSISLCAVYDGKTFILRNLGSAKYLCLPAENILLNPWMIYQAHQNNRKTFVWFQIFENPMTVRLLRLMGVDGAITETL